MIRSRVIAVSVLAAALVAIPVLPADAAPRVGWVRLAHMSPDTAAVDVTLSSLDGDVVLFKLQNVGYGAVSPYVRLPQGTYALAMVPSGAGAGATPVVSGSVKVSAGDAETVAAIGLNKDLATKVISDDLDDSGGSDARVRIVQASVRHDDVDVTAGSTTIANGASFGEVSDYSDVAAGSTKVDLVAGSDTQTETADLKAGSSHTLFVIDDKQGDLTVASALDSSASAVTPSGAVAAGGGGLAGGAEGVAGGLAAAAAFGGLVVAGVMTRRRRTARV